MKMQVEVLDIKGKKTGRKLELPDEIFAAEPNDHVIYLAVKQYLAAQRQGTHKVKTRAEVKGASRKLHRQKGTGEAAREIFVILYTKVAVPSSALSLTAMTSSSIVRLKI
jgi:hypothetical protein